MRVWHVDLRLLNLQRVLGEHRELHPILTMMRRPRYRNHWIVQRWKPHMRWLQIRHDNLVLEIYERCHNGQTSYLSWADYWDKHRTPFVLTDAEEISFDYPLTMPSEVLRDLEDLYERQPEYLIPELQSALLLASTDRALVSSISYGTNLWSAEQISTVVDAVRRLAA